MSINPDAIYAELIAARLSVPCPMPRCRAGVGRNCTTPNGWRTYHRAREKAAYGEPATPTKPRKHRLTEAQAQRIEAAAHYGQIYAADQHATLGGDAAERAVADSLLRHNLVEQTATTPSGERVLQLTADGWRTYWHHRLIIRHLPDDRHSTTCPCKGEEAFR
jgi:hypothetical protein